MTVLHHDLETRSPVDLNKSGQYVYAMDPQTQVILMSWAIDDAPVRCWHVMLGEPIPRELAEAMLDPAVTLGAHNASFERVLQTTAPARPQRFLPAPIAAALRPIERWNCTAARAAYMGLPRKLEKASLALGLTAAKDIEGAKLMMRMCKPKARDMDGDWVWHEDEASQRRLGRYCNTDVEVERALDEQLPQLSPMEMEVWRANERMNDRGIRVDEKLLTAMQFFVVEAEADVNRRLCAATNGAVPKVTATAKIKQWLVAQGFPEAEGGIGKSILLAMLENPDLPLLIREVVAMRLEGGKSSTAKYRAILARLNATDHRVRGAIVYCGAASTHRYSSRGAQLQNLTRGGTVKDINGALEAVLNGAGIAEIRQKFGAPMVVASELCRPTFTAAEDTWLARGDYAQIELRVNAWTAGEARVLDAFRAYDTIVGHDEKGKPLRGGPDIYILAAADIAGVHPSEITKDDPRRQWGKVSELACIAEGELVLTDHGLIAIENVTVEMRVWDGHDWQSHEGVVDRGSKETLTYDGLRATEDHLVWIEGACEPVAFGVAAACGARLIQSGNGRSHDRAPSPGRVRGGRDHGDGHTCGRGATEELAWDRRTARVYDILNAGPRNRFTVSGRLVHNCGFQGGVGAFQAMAKVYNVRIPDEQAEKIKTKWRESRAQICSYWKKLEDAAINCMKGEVGQRHAVRENMWFVRTGRALALRLPSGSCLFYWYPRLVQKETPWGKKRWQISYMGEDAVTKRFTRFDAYGGLFCENATQSIARDLMARSLVRMEKAGMSPVLTVHDEGVAQLSKRLYPTRESAKRAVIDVMASDEQWHRGLPIAVDASADFRYLKD